MNINGSFRRGAMGAAPRGNADSLGRSQCVSEGANDPPPDPNGQEVADSSCQSEAAPRRPKVLNVVSTDTFDASIPVFAYQITKGPREKDDDEHQAPPNPDDPDHEDEGDDE